MAEIVKKKDKRRVFIETLINLAEQDDKIVFIVNDVGFNYCEEFQKRFPTRFYNFGVTEQSSMIIAAALALSGFKPYIYSMIPFVLFRPYEMVRNAVVKHKANVKILGVEGGPSYKMLGFSHNLSSDKEDATACINLELPYFIPSTPDEVSGIIKETYKQASPCYIRL